MRHGIDQLRLLFPIEIREFELLVVHDVSLEVTTVFFFSEAKINNPLT